MSVNTTQTEELVLREANRGGNRCCSYYESLGKDRHKKRKVASRMRGPRLRKTKQMSIDTVTKPIAPGGNEQAKAVALALLHHDDTKKPVKH